MGENKGKNVTKELNHIEAFIKAQTEMEIPGFNNVNPHFKNKFADLAEITNSCKPALLANGLTPIQAYRFSGELWGVETKIVYKDGAVVSEGFYPIKEALDDQKKGSATTYGRRYSLAMACNLVAEEDDDGNAASKTTKSSKGSWNGPLGKSELKAKHKEFVMEILACEDEDDIGNLWKSDQFKPIHNQLKVDLPQDYEKLGEEIKNHKLRIKENKFNDGME